MRLESSADAFLGHSKELALLCRSVCHILFLIKVIQNEVRKIFSKFVADRKTISHSQKHWLIGHRIVKRIFRDNLRHLYTFCISIGWRGGASSLCGNVHSSSENDLQ